MQKNRVESFVDQVRVRLNKNLFQTILIWAATIGAAAIVFVGLIYILQGYAVPRAIYIAAALLSTTAVAGIWFLRRISQTEASAFADEHFGLKDSVTSARNFAKDGKSGGYFDLQAKQTDKRLNGLSSTSIPYQFPIRTMAIGGVLGAAAILMAFKAPSQAVQERVSLEIATLDQTTEMNKQLEELVEELEKEIKDEEERELVEPNKLREWVEELKATDDQKEALSQYAKLEQKLQRAASRLQQKRDEQYLERAAKELDKGEETKELAKSLQHKKYDDAAKELAKLKPEEAKSLSEQRKKLAKLKAAAKRMSAAAKNAMKQGQKSAPKPSDSQKVAKSSEQTGKKSANASKAKGQTGESQPSSEQGDQTVEELVQELEQAVEELDEQLAKAEMQEQQEGESDDEMRGECKECRGKAEKSMGKLGKKLAKMGMKKGLQAKLAGLAKACSQCQSECAGLGQSLVQSPEAGGKKAGVGSSDTKRDQRDELVDNGQFTQLKGIKGEGPSLTAVEEAEDGTGVSTGRHVAVSRSFKRQMESFVEREDVPDDVKSGVRNYFEMIHQSE